MQLYKQIMEIKVYSNDNAKKIVSKIIKKHDELYLDLHVNGWLKNDRNVKCYILCEKDVYKNIILLIKCDLDPLNQHNNPYTLSYIYTFLNHRKQKLGYKMLLYIKKKNKLLLFVSITYLCIFLLKQDIFQLIVIFVNYPCLDFHEYIIIFF